MCFIPHGCVGMHKTISQLKIILKQFGLTFAKLFKQHNSCLCNNYLEALEACVYA